jgi:hypothetical protein
MKFYAWFRKKSLLDLYVALLLAVFIAGGLSACATSHNQKLVNSTYKVLAASHESYDTAMKTAAGLYYRNLISEETKREIVKHGATYSGAHNAAVDALADYAETADAANEERLTKHLDIAADALSDLLALIQPYLGGGDLE